MTRATGNEAGFSTLGAIVSVMLLAIVLGPLVGTVVNAQRGFVDARDRARATSHARYAHLTLTRRMRSAGSSPTGSPVQAIDPDPEGDGSLDDVRLRADYNPPDGDTDDPGEDLTFFVRNDTLYVRWGPDAPEQPYLPGVEALTFEYFDRDGEPLTALDEIADRATSARITIRARGSAGSAEELIGRVRLRNSR